MKEKIRFLAKLVLFSVIVIMIISIILYIITQIDNQKFRTSYQYAINIKYNTLRNTESPKIIIVGGSSVAFGINREIIEEKVGRAVVNLGLHAGFGIYFCTEISKANINKGDIVILAYEIDFYQKEKSSIELIVAGIDNNLELYKYIINRKSKDIYKYIPTYIFKKLEWDEEKTTGVYSINSFNEYGDMILDRPTCKLPEIITKNYGNVNLSMINLDKEIIEYINDFYIYCKNKGADVVITFPPVLDERMLLTEQEMKEFEEKLKNNLLPEVISNCKDYVFPREYMYDTIYHCNNLGEKVRSEKLASDIYEYIKNKKEVY